LSRQSKVALAAIFGALVGLGTLVGVVYALRDTDDDEESAPPIATDVVETGETGELPSTEEEPTELSRTIEVGGFPNAVAVGQGSVWVVRDGRRLLRIDPDTGTIEAQIGAGDELGSERPCGVAVDRDAAWVTTVSGDVARINTRGNRLGRLVDLSGAACVALGAGGVWVTSPDLDTVTRIDPVTATVVAQVEVDGFPQGIDVGFGSVWVAAADPPDGVNGSVYRIDPQTNEIVTVIPVGALPEFLAVGAGGVWVTGSDGTVRQIEPRSNQLVDPPAQVSEDGRTSVTVGGGRVFATTITGPDAVGSVVEIDPETNEVIGAPIPVGANPIGLAFGAGSLWVANYSDGTITSYTPG